ncbi:ATP-binding protein [Lutibacter sp. B1]|uniref:ATP-binding protein n=1 Tax=Lutibacter sp. B1 TaxID=2725996 RepID=UPI0014566405|nr:ATP-binding protein [Lutibacter sp. B1]NLP58658.1 hypothetical protein [Lutibacter sp. B1]
MLNFISNLKRTYLVAFIVAIVLILLSGYLLNRQIHKLNKSADLVSQTVEVKEEIQKLYTSLVLVESAELSYSITKDTLQLQTLHNLKRKSEASLNELIKTTSNHSFQQERLLSVSKLKDSLFNSLQVVNERLDDERIGSRWVQKEMQKISDLLDDIQLLKDRLLLEEDLLLVQRMEAYLLETRTTPIVSLLMVLISISIFLLAFKKINDSRKELEETQLLLQNIFKSTENVISHFEAVRDEEDKIVDFKIRFTNEQIKNIYGDTAKNIVGKPISKIYPVLFENGVFDLLVECVDKNIPQHYERDFNFIGERKWFYNTARKINDGVTIASTDVTYQKKAEQKLAQKNKVLKRSNAELESFNRVASHDLQEPLRKIQLFISRLYDSEIDSLTEKGKLYLDKVSSSANRMQSLIQHLLLYSRITKGNQKFSPTNLNEVLEKVQEDLAEQIIDTNAKITIETLPLVKGVSFQLEQLFNNVINNSIKYRKQDVQLTIEISSKRINKKFVEIYVKDNGIGFSQEHASKIFELFQRLHQNEEYSGTGIGLAICKKIAETHNGSISAKSEPDVGTVITIKLPV